MRGEAPSQEMRSVFDHFLAWLKAIYNAFPSLGKNPQPELYAVFDRLFDTDAQIAEVHAWHEAQKPFAAALQQMQEAERAAYLKKREKAQESAEEARLRRLIKTYIKALGAESGSWTKPAPKWKPCPCIRQWCSRLTWSQLRCSTLRLARGLAPSNPDKVKKKQGTDVQ
jgi:hypothetical protein